MVLLADKESYHGMDEVKAFMKNYSLLEMRLLTMKDPNVNHIELTVNRKTLSFVQGNRCYHSTEELSASGSKFLSHCNSVYSSWTHFFFLFPLSFFTHPYSSTLPCSSSMFGPEKLLARTP